VDLNFNAGETEDLQQLQEEQEQQQQQQPEVKEMWTCPRCTLDNDVQTILDAFFMKMGRKQGVYQRDFEVLMSKMRLLLNTARVAVMVASVRKWERQSQMRHLYTVLLHLPWKWTPR
jgi:hypothetical protein